MEARKPRRQPVERLAELAEQNDLAAARAAAKPRRFRCDVIGPFWVTLRSLLLTGMWFAYYGALPEMELAVAAAALYTAPLMMAAFSALMPGERIGLSGWVAAALGLCGVMLALRPDAGALSPATAMPFLAAACYAFAAIVTRHRCAGEAPLAMALNLNLVLAAAGAAAVGSAGWFDLDAGEVAGRLAAWPALSAADIGLVCLLGALMAVIAVAVARAYQLAEPAVVGLFDNSYLVFAVAWSALFFGEVPGLLSLAGIGLVGLAAVLAARKPQLGRLPSRRKSVATGQSGPRISRRKKPM
ncbi:DMT family transporter [Jiella endophytica]|uniref:DMT family transporter n=1 Tax=Jiella endophytica TaxID=2558362 RepID=UPI001431EF65|nr:DMT family transporter [Jiella endophytica]